MSFSEQIKEARKQLNMSQQDFAKCINVSFSTVNRWENGLHAPFAFMRDHVIKFCIDNGVKFEQDWQE